MNPEWRSRYETAVAAARTAGRLALRYFEGAFQVERKGDHSPVTVADREAEQLLRRELLGRFPGDGFLGEEGGEQPGRSGYRWVVDPVDGTRSFVRGIPLWGTIVGLEQRGEPIAGVVVLPALNGGQVYRALRGDGAFKDNQRIRVSEIGRLDQSICFFSNLIYFRQAGRRDDFLRLTERVERERGLGDVYGFVLVAEGAGELMVEQGVHEWDVCGVRALIEEAGGRFTDWDGTPTTKRSDVVASNGKVHDAALRVLRGGEP
jgi:histidinol-phosphatase